MLPYIKSSFHVSYSRRRPYAGMWAMHQSSICDASRNGNMATLLNSLFFVLKCRFYLTTVSKKNDYHFVKWTVRSKSLECIDVYCLCSFNED